MFRPEFTAAEEANRCVRDILALSTLPAMWLGAEPLRIAESLAAALFTTVGADLVYVSIRDAVGANAVAVAQTGRYTTDAALADCVGNDILQWVRKHDPDELLTIPHESGPWWIAGRPLGFDAAVGVVSIGFRDPACLTPFRQMLLNVAATQAATAVENAQLLLSLRVNVAERTRRALQLRQLADAARAIHANLSLADILHHVTEQARSIIGAHRAVTTITADELSSPPVTAVSLSDEYAERRDGAPAGERSEMVQTAKQGSLAVPLVGRNGGNIGLIELSDKYDGEFSAEDQDVTVQLAQLAATAMENAHLYEETRRANQAKDEFFAVLSHELRTPLTSILGWAQLCRDEASSELVRQALDSVESSARAQARLVDELLDVSRIMTDKLTIEREPVDLSAVVAQMLDSVRPAAATRPVTLVSQVPAGIHVTGDAARLRQVVGNLLSNAVKFTPAGGLVETHLRARNGEIILSVRDTGAGIDRSLLRAIFERYEQAATGRALGGLGLGLWIVRHIVSAHGGAIDAHSEGPGRGSTFTVTLPAREWTR